MSLRYKGGVISATPPTTTGGESGTATGVWTLEQQMQINAAGNWPIQPLPKYIEDVFSIYLYTGNGSTQTITNGIDLSGKGGLVWLKKSSAVSNHWLLDTIRGGGKPLNSNSTNAEPVTTQDMIRSFNSNGFSLGTEDVNDSSATYASWTFRKQTKFFDIVTYTGDGTNTRYINHNLGSAPGFIVVKCTSDGSANSVWSAAAKTSSGATNLLLNTTAAGDTDAFNYGYVHPGSITDSSYNSTQFRVDRSLQGITVNNSGQTYVAYLFAHDAGGFGPLGTDSVISCGSFTHNGTNTAVNLGWEPQFLILKRVDTTGYWEMYDNIRGFGVGSVLYYLYPNATFAETSNSRGGVTATGVTWDSGLSAGDYVYIAIRRGPMKTPTSGTDIYKPITWTGSNAARTITGLSWPLDMCFTHIRNNGGTSQQSLFFDRMRGATATYARRIAGTSTNGETNYTAVGSLAIMNGLNILDGDSLINDAGIPSTYIGYFFRRAPGAFDVVCYTGTGSARTVNHSLGVAPELMVVKRRSSTADWPVYSTTITNARALFLNQTAAQDFTDYWNDTTPTSSVFSVGTDLEVNASGSTYVAYLFATVAGVSKVGSYTGTGALQTIDCGFTTGARFVLIKRTDSTGGWYIYDSARGISSSDDPYFFMNSVAAEVTNTNYVDTDTTGFKVTAAAPSALNANGGTYIFLAIA